MLKFVNFTKTQLNIIFPSSKKISSLAEVTFNNFTNKTHKSFSNCFPLFLFLRFSSILCSFLQVFRLVGSKVFLVAVLKKFFGRLYILNVSGVSLSWFFLLNLLLYFSYIFLFVLLFYFGTTSLRFVKTNLQSSIQIFKITMHFVKQISVK